MQIEKLQSFVKLCETGNITKCAENLHITQQGLSRQMKSMEEELGVSLFKRSVKGVTLTEEGALIRPYFEQACSQYEQGIRELEKARNDFRQKLTVVACPGIQHALGLDFFIRFQQQNPQIRLDFYFSSDAQSEEDLLSGKADAAFLDAPEHADLYDNWPVVHSRCVAIVKKDHAFASEKSISFYDLKGKTVYIPDKSHRKTIQFEKVYPDLFRSIHITYASNAYDSYFTLPKYFDGIGLTFHFLCNRLDEDLVEVPIREDSYVSLVFCSRKKEKNGTENPAVMTFTKYVRETVPSVIC